MFTNCYSYGMDDCFILLCNLLFITVPINIVTSILHMFGTEIFYMLTKQCEQIQLSSRHLRSQANTLSDKCSGLVESR